MQNVDAVHQQVLSDVEGEGFGGLELLEGVENVLNVGNGALAVGDGGRNLGEALSDQLDAVLDTVNALLLDVLDGHVEVVVHFVDVTSALLQVWVLFVLEKSLNETLEDVEGLTEREGGAREKSAKRKGASERAGGRLTTSYFQLACSCP